MNPVPEKTAQKNLPENSNQPRETIAERLDDLEILVRKNIQWNEVVYEECKKTRRRLSWMAFGNWIRLLLVLTPFILGAIFLPRLYRQAKDLYEKNIVAPQQKVESEFNRAFDFIRGFKSSSSTDNR